MSKNKQSFIKNFHAKLFADITTKNFTPIYLPMIISFCLFIMGVIIYLMTNSLKVFKTIFGISGLIFSLSGIGQILRKEVPGFPTLRGGCAVMFGVVFVLFFALAGIGVLFSE